MILVDIGDIGEGGRGILGLTRWTVTLTTALLVSSGEQPGGLMGCTKNWRRLHGAHNTVS